MVLINLSDCYLSYIICIKEVTWRKSLFDFVMDSLMCRLDAFQALTVTVGFRFAPTYGYGDAAFQAIDVRQ